jgi:hypothetical protein
LGLNDGIIQPSGNSGRCWKLKWKSRDLAWSDLLSKNVHRYNDSAFFFRCVSIFAIFFLLKIIIFLFCSFAVFLCLVIIIYLSGLNGADFAISFAKESKISQINESCDALYSLQSVPMLELAMSGRHLV